MCWHLKRFSSVAWEAGGEGMAYVALGSLRSSSRTLPGAKESPRPFARSGKPTLEVRSESFQLSAEGGYALAS